MQPYMIGPVALASSHACCSCLRSSLLLLPQVTIRVYNEGAPASNTHTLWYLTDWKKFAHGPRKGIIDARIQLGQRLRAHSLIAPSALLDLHSCLLFGTRDLSSLTSPYFAFITCLSGRQRPERINSKQAFRSIYLLVRIRFTMCACQKLVSFRALLASISI